MTKKERAVQVSLGLEKEYKVQVFVKIPIEYYVEVYVDIKAVSLDELRSKLTKRALQKQLTNEVIIGSDDLAEIKDVWAYTSGLIEKKLTLVGKVKQSWIDVKDTSIEDEDENEITI